jgi:hypothetical protein
VAPPGQGTALVGFTKLGKEVVMRKVLAFLFLALLAASAWATTLLCNIDKLSLHFTGKTKSEQGILLFQHQCPQRHTFWLTQEQMNQ